MVFKRVFLGFLEGRGFKGTLEIAHGRDTYRFGKGRKVVMDVKTSFFRRVVLFGDIGFGEAYMHGDFTTPDLKALLLWFAENRRNLPGFVDGKKPRSFEWAALIPKVLHIMRRNTRVGSRKNIHAHYDLSNRFYSLWLDKSMAYSCAHFGKGMGLEQAQENKYRAICRKICLTGSDHLLEIGTGWGGFAIYAAKNHSCRITTITISRKQYDYARQRIRKEGLEKRIDLRLQDYRDLKGAYDKIVSIEMMEALGYAYVPLFMDICARLLKRGGLMCHQVITFPDEHFKDYLSGQDFTKKHIFPGGELVSIAQLKELARQNRLKVQDISYYGSDYAKTLSAWRQRFMSNLGKVRSLGFDDVFCRKWEYYLTYCEVGFLTGYIDDAQVVFSR